jgi:hypothetical protein
MVVLVVAIAAERSGGWAVPNGLERVVYRMGMTSWRYFVEWIPSSEMNVDIHPRRKVDSLGCGKEVGAFVDAGVDELMWWKDKMRFDRRILVRFVI